MSVTWSELQVLKVFDKLKLNLLKFSTWKQREPYVLCSWTLNRTDKLCLVKDFNVSLFKSASKSTFVTKNEFDWSQAPNSLNQTVWCWKKWNRKDHCRSKNFQFSNLISPKKVGPEIGSDSPQHCSRRLRIPALNRNDFHGGNTKRVSYKKLRVLEIDFKLKEPRKKCSQINRGCCSRFLNQKRQTI